MGVKDTIIASEAELLELFDNFNVPIYRYIYLRVNNQVEVAEDLAQEVFLKAWRARASFDPGKSSIQTWLFRIARNLVIDYYRSAKRNTEITLDGSESEPISDIDVESEVVSTQLVEYILNQLKSLAEADQELIILRYIQNLELVEIAEIVQKTKVATKVALHRALAKLKHKLEQENS